MIVIKLHCETICNITSIECISDIFYSADHACHASFKICDVYSSCRVVVSSCDKFSLILRLVLKRTKSLYVTYTESWYHL